LILIGSPEERVTLVAQWEGESPDDAILQKLQRRQKRGENPVLTMAFSRRKYADKNFIQIEIPG
ncbi:unnamed protein product, partial [Amoebophrya sp. A25]